jgi:hypothetical protein
MMLYCKPQQDGWGEQGMQIQYGKWKPAFETRVAQKQ